MLRLFSCCFHLHFDSLRDEKQYSGRETDLSETSGLNLKWKEEVVSMLLAISAQTVFSILLTVLIILFAVLLILYFLGRRLQAKQAMQQPMLEANTMEVSMLIIDKKKMRVKEAVSAGLPEQVEKEMPVYARLTKLPIVKAKVGPRVLTLMSDPEVYEILPLKKEVKVAVSGIYIRSIKSVRGGTVQEKPKKTGLFAGLRKKAEKAVKENGAGQAKKKK